MARKRSNRNNSSRRSGGQRSNVSRIELQQSFSAVVTTAVSDNPITLNSLNLTGSVATRPCKVRMVRLEGFCSGNTTDQGGLNCVEAQLLTATNSSTSGIGAFSSHPKLISAGNTGVIILRPPTILDFDDYSGTQALFTVRARALAATNTNFSYVLRVWLEFLPPIMI